MTYDLSPFAIGDRLRVNILWVLRTGANRMQELVKSYRDAAGNHLFVSGIASFTVFVAAMKSLAEVAFALYSDDFPSAGLLQINGLLVAVIFLALIAIVFAARLMTLSFSSDLAVKASWVFWVLGIVLLLGYMLHSRRDPVPFGIYNSTPDSLFRHSSILFDFVAFLYLCTSPVHQIWLILKLWIRTK